MNLYVYMKQVNENPKIYINTQLDKKRKYNMTRTNHNSREITMAMWRHGSHQTTR